MFHIIEGKVPTFRDGEHKWIRAFQYDTAEKIDFGGPVGEVTLFMLDIQNQLHFLNIFLMLKKSQI